MTENVITMKSSPAEKINLMRGMFSGRQDVFAKRYERKDGKGGYSVVCTNEWVRGVCGKCAKVRHDCSTCPSRAFTPISDTIIEQHLRGKDGKGKPFVIGVYPMHEDDTVRFAAIDFDKSSWRTDSYSTIKVLENLGLPIARERSRSGNGAHLWFFFEENVSAEIVRDVLTFILSLTMEQNPSMGFDSYDRIFPCQNRKPKGGFGNLIALPLQGLPRSVGNSLFVNENLVPYFDQWEFLSNIPFIPKSKLIELRSRALSEKRIITPQVTEEIERNEPWSLFGFDSKKICQESIERPTSPIQIVIKNAIYIAQEHLSPQLRGKLMRLAAFANPEFKKAEWMRLPIYNIPRVIHRSIDGETYLILPRGILNTVTKTLRNIGAKTTIEDKRFGGREINLEFTGNLRPEQKEAGDALIAHDTGVLSARTAFGKTVLAAWIIATRKTNTLILVNRKQLADQWMERLSQFLSISKNDIGLWGGNKRKLTGKIDVALIQSLVHKGNVNRQIVGDYGQLIVDECHGISAPSFEAVANAFTGKYILGLSATLVRKDGLHPIIYMQCGPVRYQAKSSDTSLSTQLEQRVEVRLTDFHSQMTFSPDDEKKSYSEIIEELINNEKRNQLIITDVLDAVANGRSPVILTERRKHLEILKDKLEGKEKHLLVLHGGLSAKDIKALHEQRMQIPDSEPRILLATGPYLGEGFDDARLDTLFLALPISWKGRLTQYAGRLHRQHDGKREVIIYDYADTNIQMFSRMFNKRCAGYKAIGYKIMMPVPLASGLPYNVSLIRSKKLDETYTDTVRRILRDGVSADEIDLFVLAAEQIAQSNAEEYSEGKARSAVEHFLYQYLNTTNETKGKFSLNKRLKIPFAGNPDMEVDIVSEEFKLAIEIDGIQHLLDKEAYRRDRRKDELLQENGFFVLRFLAEDVLKHLGEIMTKIVHHMNRKNSDG